jgi:hypothetical protein
MSRGMRSRFGVSRLWGVLLEKMIGWSCDCGDTAPSVSLGGDPVFYARYEATHDLGIEEYIRELCET